jgi:hypothetical protein
MQIILLLPETAPELQFKEEFWWLFLFFYEWHNFLWLGRVVEETP